MATKVVHVITLSIEQNIRSEEGGLGIGEGDDICREVIGG